jgi:hypothetical protein
MLTLVIGVDYSVDRLITLVLLQKHEDPLPCSPVATESYVGPYESKPQTPSYFSKINFNPLKPNGKYMSHLL